MNDSNVKDSNKPLSAVKVATPFFAKNLEGKKLTVRTNLLAGEEETSRTRAGT